MIPFIFPDLGPYKVEVLSAYAGTILLLLALVVASIWQGRKTRARLDDYEARRAQKRDSDGDAGA